MSMSTKTFTHNSLFVLLANLILCIPIFAQVSGGNVSGTITDPSGAVVPAAEVSITSTDTGITRTVTTNSDGFYAAPNLRPGNYEVTCTAKGFTKQKKTGVSVTVGSQEVVDLKLGLGNVAQTVEVVEKTSNVELATSDLGGIVGSTTVQELPLNGRSWTDLTTLQPGVSHIETQVAFTDSGRGNRGFGTQVAISGARPQQNNYRLDGVSVNDYANGGPASVTGGSLGVDAIQEFSVVTTNASAEYGRVAGGVVNARSRSGTNSFHGSVYEFMRNSAVDAKGYFDDAQKPIPPFKRNQFGASAGGPIIKNRTFIFGDFEAIRQSKGISSLTTVPSSEARLGHLCSVPDSSCTTPNSVTVDQSPQKYLGFYHVPNQGLVPGSGGDIGFYTFSGQQVVNENFFTIRADHKLSEKDSLAATYLYDRTPFNTPDSLNDVLFGSFTKRQTVVLEETHMFTPQVLNSFRFGFNRDRVDNNIAAGAINPLAADASLAAVPGRFAASVLVHGLTDFYGGKYPRSTFLYRWNSFQAYDDAFVTHGLHSLKLGFAYEHIQMYELTNTEAAGTFNFPSLKAFLQNQPSRFRTAFPTLLTPRYMRQSILGFYVQDDWRWRPNLTLNFGLRYETASVPTEIHGQLATLYNITDAAPHCGKVVAGCVAAGPYFLNPTRRNFEPRIGFAWDPFSNGKTALRGGFGFYDVLPLQYQFVTLNGRAFPFFEIGSSKTCSTATPPCPPASDPLPPGSFYAGAFANLGAGNFEVPNIEFKPKRNYVMQWNLNLQRDIIPNLTATIGYVGSRSVHQPFRTDDSDIVIPKKTPAGYLWPSPIGSRNTINPAFGDIRYLHWAGDSYYHALQVGLTKRMTHGFLFQGSYTWGKSIDTSSGVVAGDTLANSISSLHFFDLKANRAVSDFNVARTFVLSATWQLPISVKGPASWLTNGWQVGGIFTANSGVPFTPTFGTDGDPLGSNVSDPYDFPSRLTGAGCGSAVNPGNPSHYIKTECFAVPTWPDPATFAANCDTAPNLANPLPAGQPDFRCFNLRGNAGRNSLVGPGLVDLNFSVFKNNKISERFNIQIRAEVFNVLNHPNFSVPSLPGNTDIFDSTGAPSSTAGILTSTTTTAREIQLALKLIW
jgi:hypothetical protein